MVTFAILSKLLINIIIMLGLAIMVLGSSKNGLLDIVLYPLQKIKSNRLIFLFWFLFSTFLTAIMMDTLQAIILAPIALIYCENKDLDKQTMLVTIGLGAVVGNDLTYFGGGDTIIARTLIENMIHRPLDMITWFNLVGWPTVISIVVISLWLWFFVFEKKVIKPFHNNRKIVINSLFIIQSIVIVGGIITAFYNKLVYLTIGASIVCLIICNIPNNLKIQSLKENLFLWIKNIKNDLKRLPLKAIYTWTAAIILGIFIDAYIKTNFKFTLPSNISSFWGVLIITIIVCGLTQIITNSGLAAFILPLTLSIPYDDKAWLIALVLKGISASYLTVWANGCFTVTAGYGLSHKRMFKEGLPPLILHILIMAIYFYYTQGLITL